MCVFSQLDIAASFKNITMILQKWQENYTFYSKDIKEKRQRYVKEVCMCALFNHMNVLCFKSNVCSSQIDLFN